jgi:anti-sigma factor RsiW
MSDVTPGPLDESLLSAYLDGELDDRERAAVDARLAESAEWRAVLDEVRGTRVALRNLPAVDAPAEFWDRVLQSDGVVVDLATATRRRARLLRRTSAAAAVAAAVLGVAFVPRPDTVQPPIGAFTQAHAERASLDSDVVSNLAGAVVPTGLER